MVVDELAKVQEVEPNRDDSHMSIRDGRVMHHIRRLTDAEEIASLRCERNLLEKHAEDMRLIAMALAGAPVSRPQP